MKIFKEGDKSRAICPSCGLVETSFKIKDVPIKGTNAVANNILAAVCSGCNQVVSIPQQSATYVNEVLKKDIKPLEVRVPQHLSDILANASIKINGSYSSVLVNFLIKHYIHNHHDNAKAIRELKKIYKNSDLLIDVKSKSRLSMKVDKRILDELIDIKKSLKFESEAEAVKAIVLKINDDILQENDKNQIDFLQNLASAIA